MGEARPEVRDEKQALEYLLDLAIAGHKESLEMSSPTRSHNALPDLYLAGMAEGYLRMAGAIKQARTERT